MWHRHESGRFGLVQTIENLPECRELRFTEMLARTLQVPTISTADPQVFYTLHDVLKREYPLLHSSKHIERHVINDLSLVYIWKGESRDTLMLCAHQDVVPVDNATMSDWHMDPFAGNVTADGFLYGRGALDFKNGVVGIMNAVERLLKQGVSRTKHTIILALGHDEELSGAHGAGHIA